MEGIQVSVEKVGPQSDISIIRVGGYCPYSRRRFIPGSCHLSAEHRHHNNTELYAIS